MTEWIEWAGGECPIPDSELANYKLMLRGGKEVFGGNFEAYIWTDWNHKGDEFDIIAYRLIEKEQSDLDWLEPLVQVEFDHQNAKPPSYASIAAREAYRNVLDLIKQRKEAKP